MPPQNPVCARTPEVRLAFEAYKRNKQDRKALMNATKRAQYLHFLANSEQKIIEKDKAERARLLSEKRRAIEDSAWTNEVNFVMLIMKKGDITKPQAFAYDTFDQIERIHAAGGHNGYKKTFQRTKKGMGYQELTFSGYLSIVKCVCSIDKISPEHRCNLWLSKR